METTSQRLQKIMEERGLRQKDVLDLCKPFCNKYFVNISRSDLSQFVTGKVKPGQWKLAILGMALNVSEGWLMGLDVPMERGEKEKPAADEGDDLARLLAGADATDLKILRAMATLDAAGRKELMDYALYLSQRGK